MLEEMLETLKLDFNSLNSEHEYVNHSCSCVLADAWWWSTWRVPTVVSWTYGSVV